MLLYHMGYTRYKTLIMNYLQIFFTNKWHKEHHRITPNSGRAIKFRDDYPNRKSPRNFWVSPLLTHPFNSHTRSFSNKVDFTIFHLFYFSCNYSAIINVEYQELINLTLWQKGSKWHSLLEFVCMSLCNILIINNSL